MGIESATKQDLMRKHIDQVVKRKKAELERNYLQAKKEYLATNFQRRKMEIHDALDEILSRARAVKDEFSRAKKKLNYDHWWDISVPHIEDDSIERAVEQEFGESMEKRRQEIEDAIEEARLETIEKVLFADEQQLRELVGQLKSMKVEL